jgi:WD40 repeat protein
MIPSRFPFFFVAACLLSVGGTWFVALGQDLNDADAKAPIIEPQVLHVLKRENGFATFTFSRNGKRFAMNDGPVARVWDTGTWKEVAIFTDKTETNYKYVLLSPNGGVLGLTSNLGEEIKLFDVESGRLLRTLNGHEARIVSSTFSPDGKTIAATDDNADLKLWDVETGKDLDRFKTKPKDSGHGRNLAFSPDGKTLAVATPDGEIHLLGVKKGEEIRKFTPTDPAFNQPRGLAFSPDGRFLAAGAWQLSNVTIWDVSTGKVFCQLQWPVQLDRKRLARNPDSHEPDPKRPPRCFHPWIQRRWPIADCDMRGWLDSRVGDFHMVHSVQNG